MTIIASRVQIAVELTNDVSAQAALDTACPGVFDVLTADRSLRANSDSPTVAAWSVAQGDVDQEQYALLATLALAAGIHHLSIGVWVGNTYEAASQAGTLWDALGLVDVADPE